jgi:transmembrane sensor
MSPIDRQALRWVARAGERAHDAAARAAFDAWYAADIRHQGAYLRAMAIDQALDHAAALDTVAAAPEAMRAPMLARRAFIGAGSLAAGVAILAILAATGLLPSPDRATTLATNKGERRSVTLADHSTVSLNGSSRLAVVLAQHDRRIDLQQGEAWFKVAADKARPFIVAARDVRVRAVGTEFAVRRHGNGADILVTEGRVEVWSETGAAPKRLVHAGEGAFVAQRAASIDATRAPADIARKLAWREGRLVFQNQTLGDAVAEFNRYSARPIVIAVPALRGKTLVGQYQIDAPERFATDVGALLNVPVHIGADAIVIGAPAR